jgi:type III restriction enzyme
VVVDPPLFNEDDKRRRIVITLNMTKIVQHIWEAIRFENALTLEPVFDTERPIRSTGDMLPWYSGKACEHTKRSHINMCVYDSRWEANESLELDRNQNVRAWVKNDHIGFEITYSFKGIIHKFRPDYSSSADERQNADFGSKGPGRPATTNEAGILIRMGQGGERARRLR